MNIIGSLILMLGRPDQNGWGQIRQLYMSLSSQFVSIENERFNVEIF